MLSLSPKLGEGQARLEINAFVKTGGEGQARLEINAFVILVLRTVNSPPSWKPKDRGAQASATSTSPRHHIHFPCPLVLCAVHGAAQPKVAQIPPLFALLFLGGGSIGAPLRPKCCPRPADEAPLGEAVRSPRPARPRKLLHPRQREMCSIKLGESKGGERGWR
jgi:hypothetical protein